MFRWITLSVVMIGCCGPLAAAEPFAFRDGDRVVLVGNTLIERAGRYPHLELALAVRHAEKRITFRNLGWSGDNVLGESRAYFGTPADGFKHLLEYVDLLKPTVIIAGYGNIAAHEGKERLKNFISQYERLLAELEKRTKRVILLSPTPAEKLGPPLPDPGPLNANRELYSQAIAQLAKRRGHRYVDLFRPLLKRQASERLTDNGIHFTDRGYEVLADVLDADLAGGKPAIEISPGIRDQLGQLIVDKNELFFHRYRPQNETYLRGFRKYEQGQNAVEILKFDPLVEKKEAEIAKVCREVARLSKP